MSTTGPGSKPDSALLRWVDHVSTGTPVAQGFTSHNGEMLICHTVWKMPKTRDSFRYLRVDYGRVVVNGYVMREGTLLVVMSYDLDDLMSDTVQWTAT